MATKKLTLDKVLKMAQLLEKFGRTGDRQKMQNALLSKEILKKKKKND